MVKKWSFTRECGMSAVVVHSGINGGRGGQAAVKAGQIVVKEWSNKGKLVIQKVIK